MILPKNPCESNPRPTSMKVAKQKDLLSLVAGTSAVAGLEKLTKSAATAAAALV